MQSDHVPGVIRLLEEGHFKGVADVRLRINFFDELSARADAAAGAAAGEGAGGLIEGVTTKLGELTSGLGLDETGQAAVEAAGADFEEAVRASVTEATSGGKIDQAGLTGSIQQAFDALVTQLRGLLAPPPQVDLPPTEAPPAETPPAASPDGVAPTGPASAPAAVAVTLSSEISPAADGKPAPASGPLDLEALLTQLSDAFQAGLQAFSDSIQSVGLLPDPTPPTNGHGAAFEKFLAIYDQLGSPTPEVNELG